MPFFLVGRSRDDLSLTLLSTEVFDTRDLAARAVQSVALSGGIDVDAVDVFIADLGAAAPVVLVGLPVAAPVVDAAAAGAWETPESDAGDDVSADAAIEEVAAEVDALEASDALAAALERATSSMAAEGIVPPESVGFTVMSEEDSAPVVAPEPEPDPEPEPEPVAAVFEESAEIAAPLMDAPAVDVPIVEVSEPELTSPGALEPTDISDDLSAVIASLTYSEEPVLAEPTPLETGEVVPVDEPGADDAMWPWLNVDEVDAAVASEPEVEAPAEPASVSLVEPEPEAVAVVEPVLLADDSLIANIALDDEPFAPQPVIMGDYADAPVGPEAPTTAYEPAGDLSLADYTCADCIYSNTCPKVNESKPAECGSFQWKAL